MSPVINPATLGTLGIFVSTELTGDAAEETIAHGLARVPTVVFTTITDNNGGADAVVTEGTHTATNVIVTVSTGAKYKVLAM